MEKSNYKQNKDSSALIDLDVDSNCVRITPSQCVSSIIYALQAYTREEQERILRAAVAFYGLSDIDV